MKQSFMLHIMLFLVVFTIGCDAEFWETDGGFARIYKDQRDRGRTEAYSAAYARGWVITTKLEEKEGWNLVNYPHFIRYFAEYVVKGNGEKASIAYAKAKSSKKSEKFAVAFAYANIYGNGIIAPYGYAKAIEAGYNEEDARIFAKGWYNKNSWDYANAYLEGHKLVSAMIKRGMIKQKDKLAYMAFFPRNYASERDEGGSKREAIYEAMRAAQYFSKQGW